MGSSTPTQLAASVPAIPQVAIPAIQDPNTQAVLGALTAAWNVRNGQTGNGDQAFVTYAALGMSSSGPSGGVSSVSVGTNAGLPGFLTPGVVTTLISKIQSAIEASPFYQSLGTQIQSINLGTINAATAAAIAADAAAAAAAEASGVNSQLQTEITNRTAADNALAESQTTAIAAVNSTVAGLQTTLTATSNAVTANATSTTNQFASVNSTIAGIQTSLTSTANAVTANAASTTEQFATVNGNISALQTSMTTNANTVTANATSTSTQFSQVNSNIAALQSTYTTLSNTVAANASSITTLQSNVGANSAAISTEASTRANADSALQAQYTVKVDVNGYVSGYGLASEANDGTPTSTFDVRADCFAIGSPSGPGIAPAVPFVVYTTQQTVGGQTVAPGVYMASAMIANGTIDTAMIANAAITNAQIATEAVGTSQIQNAAITNATIATAAVGTLTVAGNAVSTMAQWIGLGEPDSPSTPSINYVASGGNLLIFVSGGMQSGEGSGEGLGTASLLLNGNTISSQTSYTMNFFGAALSQTGNCSVEVAGGYGAISITVFEVKR